MSEQKTKTKEMKLDWVHICITGKKELALQIKTMLDLCLSWLIVDSDKDKGAKMLRFPDYGEYLNNTNPLAFYVLDKGGHDLGEKFGFIIKNLEER